MPKIRSVENHPSPTHIYIGVDPGASGGLVFISSGRVEATPMPETERDIWLWFRDLGQFHITHAVIENVHAMPSQGVTSMFSFGKIYGLLRMALIAAEIPFEEVGPRTWQKALGVVPKKKEESKVQFKQRLLALAQQLYPNLEIWTQKKSKNKQLAICDAILLATYCQRKQEGRL